MTGGTRRLYRWAPQKQATCRDYRVVAYLGKMRGSRLEEALWVAKARGNLDARAMLIAATIELSIAADLRESQMPLMDAALRLLVKEVRREERRCGHPPAKGCR